MYSVMQMGAHNETQLEPHSAAVGIQLTMTSTSWLTHAGVHMFTACLYVVY